MDNATIEWVAQVASAARLVSGIAAACLGMGLMFSVIAWVVADYKEEKALAFGVGRQLLFWLAVAIAVVVLVPGGDIIRLAAKP